MEEEIGGGRQGTLGTADTPGQRGRQAQRLSLPTLDHLEEPASLLELVNAAARTRFFLRLEGFPLGIWKPSL